MPGSQCPGTPFSGPSPSGCAKQHAAFPRVPGGSRHSIGGAAPRADVSRDSLQPTLHEGVCGDPHSPGDAYVGRGHRLPPGRRQHENGGPLDPAIQGARDVRIRRVMVARTPPRVDSRGGCRADVAGRAGSHRKTGVAASTTGRRRGCQEKIGGRQRHGIWGKRGSPCRESEGPKGQRSDLHRGTAGRLGAAHSTRAGRRGDDGKNCARPTPNRKKRRAVAWRTKLKEKEGGDDSQHPSPPLEDEQPPRAKVLLRPGPGRAEHEHE